MTNRFSDKIESNRPMMTDTLGAFFATAMSLTESRASLTSRLLRNDKADVITNKHPGEVATLVVPGFHANGRVIAKNMDRHLRFMGPTLFAVHPEKGFSLDSTKEEWVKAIRKLGQIPLQIYAQSMGGMLALDVLSDESVRKQLPQINVLEIDSGLSKPDDLPLGTRAAMFGTKLLPLTRLSDKLYTLAMMQETKKPIDRGDDETAEEAFEHILSSALTGYDAGKGQIGYILETDVGDMDLSGLSEDIGRAIYISAASDNVLDIFGAASTINNSLGGGMQHVIDSRRAPMTHAAGAEHTRGVIDNLLGRNQEDYRVISIRDHLAKRAVRQTMASSSTTKFAKAA